MGSKAKVGVKEEIEKQHQQLAKKQLEKEKVITAAVAAPSSTADSIYGTELVLLAVPSPPPGLCLLNPEELPRRLIGMCELAESKLPRLRVDE